MMRRWRGGEDEERTRRWRGEDKTIKGYEECIDKYHLESMFLL